MRTFAGIMVVVVAFVLGTQVAAAGDAARHEREWEELSGRQALAVALSLVEVKKQVPRARLSDYWVGVRSPLGETAVVVSWNPNDKAARDGDYAFRIEDTGEVGPADPTRYLMNLPDDAGVLRPSGKKRQR